MPFKTFVCCMLSLDLLLVSACTKPQKTPVNNVLAKVNGAMLTEDDLHLALQGGHGGGETSDRRTRALEDLIDQELLYQEGLKLGLDADPKYRNLITVMEIRLKSLKRAELARRVTSTRIAAPVEVAYEDAKNYYVQNKKMITHDLRLLIMRFSEEEKARAAHRKILNGTAFEAVAEEVYRHVPKGRGLPWDPGSLRWDQIPMEWTEAVYSLSNGETSDVIGTDRTGWCIVKLVDRKKNPDVAFDRMSAIIMNRLRDMRIKEAYARYIQELRKASMIVKHDERRDAS